MKTLKSLGSLGALNTNDKIKLFGAETKVKVTLVTGGRLWLENQPNSEIERTLLFKHHIGRSQVKRVERVEVAAH